MANKNEIHDKKDQRRIMRKILKKFGFKKGLYGSYLTSRDVFVRAELYQLRYSSFCRLELFFWLLSPDGTCDPMAVALHEFDFQASVENWSRKHSEPFPNFGYDLTLPASPQERYSAMVESSEAFLAEYLDFLSVRTNILELSRSEALQETWRVWVTIDEQRFTN